MAGAPQVVAIFPTLACRSFIIHKALRPAKAGLTPDPLFNPTPHHRGARGVRSDCLGINPGSSPPVLVMGKPETALSLSPLVCKLMPIRPASWVLGGSDEVIHVQHLAQCLAPRAPSRCWLLLIIVVIITAQPVTLPLGISVGETCVQLTFEQCGG